MLGAFLLARDTTGGNMAISKSLTVTRADLDRRQWVLIV
jgi:hypothetical protein